jgi:hypothetical protein
MISSRSRRLGLITALVAVAAAPSAQAVNLTSDGLHSPSAHGQKTHKSRAHHAAPPHHSRLPHPHRPRHHRHHHGPSVGAGTDATAVAPIGAAINTMASNPANSSSDPGLLIDNTVPGPAATTGKANYQWYPGPDAGKLAVYGFDPATLRADRDDQTVIGGGDVDKDLDAALKKFPVDELIVLVGTNGASTQSKKLPTTGPWSHIFTDHGNGIADVNESGSWNRGLRLGDGTGATSPAGALTGRLRFDASSNDYRFVQTDRVPFSTAVSTQATLGASDGAVYRFETANGQMIAAPTSHGALVAAARSNSLMEQWELRRAYGSYFTLVNVASSQCMDVSGNDDVSVIQWPCDPSNALNQLWLVDEHNGKVSLEPAALPGEPQTIGGGYAATLASTGQIQAQRMSPTSQTAQDFELELAPGVYNITDSSNDQVVSEPDFQASWGTQLVLQAKGADATQQWRLVDGPGDSFKLVNVASGLCMDARAADPTPGTVVERYACDPNGQNQTNELWKASADTDGVVLTSAQLDQVLSARGGKLQRDTDDDAVGQRWRLDRVAQPVAAGGAYVLTPMTTGGWNDGKALRATANGTTAMPVTLAQQSTDPAPELWQLRAAAGGTVELYNAAANFCLDRRYPSGDVSLASVTTGPCNPATIEFAATAPRS